MIVYVSKYTGKKSDFKVLMNKDRLKNTLIIFNDNQKEHETVKLGKGNANMRPYNKYGTGFVRSAGIPTGFYRTGFTELSDEISELLDFAIDEIKTLLNSGNYDSILYSVDSYSSLILGTSIFHVNEDVLKYITYKLLELGESIIPIIDGEIDDSKEVPITEELLNSIIE